MESLGLVVLIVVIALLFDFFNGFNDAANSIATVVATRVLTPRMAVFWAAFFNFIAAFGFGTAVAKTIGSGLVSQDIVTEYVVLTGVLAAAFWVWAASRLGMPVSASHALVSGYAGAAVAKVGVTQGWGSILNALVLDGPLLENKWALTVAGIAIAPVLGMIGGATLMIAVAWIFRNGHPRVLDRYFRKMQLFSSAVFSFAHGTNDAQKTMGIIASVLWARGLAPNGEIPTWVILSAYGAISLGTYLGGWRVIRTMGHRITKLDPVGGFCAETGGAFTVLFAAAQGIPASTTHTIAGAIGGVGTAKRIRAVRWDKAREIVWAWILTIPITAMIGVLFYLCAHLFAG